MKGTVIWLRNACPQCQHLIPFEAQDIVPNRTQYVACVGPGCKWSGVALLAITLEKFLAGREYMMNPTRSVDHDVDL